MKVLLDEHMPHQLRPLLVGHDVYTIWYLGWTGTKNGALLRRAGSEGFDVIVTLDGNIEHQQNVQTLPLTVLIVSAAQSDFDVMRPLVPAMLDGLLRISPNTILHVP